jgi:hypothetical protein
VALTGPASAEVADTCPKPLLAVTATLTFAPRSALVGVYEACVAPAMFEHEGWQRCHW